MCGVGRVIDDGEILELLKPKGQYLFHREGQTLEFKEQFNLAGLADYFRDFAAFSNNRGGYLVFGVTDSPRVATGLSEKSLAAFQKIDPEKISGYLLEIFSSEISWAQTLVEFGGKQFGAFKILEADIKPVIARKDEGKDQVIRNGEIYYRYAGRTQRIQSAELEGIINKRIEFNNKEWIDLVKSIGLSGPSNSVVLKTNNSFGENGTGPIVIDKELAKQLKFIKQGQFKEKAGAKTLKLVGDILPVDTVEVEKIVKQNRLDEYPLSATELARLVHLKCKGGTSNVVWKAINENGLKGNPSYSCYNFRNRKFEKKYEETGKVASNTPVIYNHAAVDFLCKILAD
jgi:Putative DNA-binding domain